MELISPKNPLVKAWRQLLSAQGRKAQQRFLAEGNHLVQEALSAGAAETLIVDRESQDRYAGLMAESLPCYVVSPEIIKALSDSKTPQGVLAVCPLPKPAKPAGKRLVALNQVQDPGNVGAILRSMDAAGSGTMLIDTGCADPFSPKALRASMGAVFRVPVIWTADLAGILSGLKESGCQLIAGDLRGDPFFDHPLYEAFSCLLIGNEGAGLEPDLLALSDLRLKLPMPGGAESLNAAVAASLMIYDILRQDMGSGTQY